MLGAVIDDFSTAHMQSAQISQINLGLRGLKGNSHQKISVATRPFFYAILAQAIWRREIVKKFIFLNGISVVCRRKEPLIA